MENHELFFIFEHMVCSLLLLTCFFTIFMEIKKRLFYHAIPSKAHTAEMSISVMVNMRTTLKIPFLLKRKHTKFSVYFGLLSTKSVSPMFLH